MHMALHAMARWQAEEARLCTYTLPPLSLVFCVFAPWGRPESFGGRRAAAAAGNLDWRVTGPSVCGD